MSSAKPHVLILGGGYVGLYAAWGLQKRCRELGMRITVVEPEPYMVYQPLLPEVAGGEVEPRNVTVQLRRALRHVELFRGRVDAVDTAAKRATLTDLDGDTTEVGYDHVVFAVGAVTRVFPTPGLEDEAIGFKTMEEAVYLRNRVLEGLATAASADSAAERRRALTFVFIGGGYTGVEAIAELSDLAKIAAREYSGIHESDLNFVLIEAGDGIAKELGPQLSKWTLGHLRKRGIDVRLDTTMKSCVDGVVELSTGDRFESDLIVWSAGVQPNPVLDATDVPRGPKGHAIANVNLQVTTDDGEVVDGAWAAGDCAQVPDLTAEKQPAYYPGNAQNAVRQAKLLARNIVATVEGGEPQQYVHTSLGTLASFGVGKGAAVVFGVKLRGLPAWIVDRAYHGASMPTLSRKVRVFSGWLVDLVTPRDISEMRATEQPRRSFVSAVAAEKHEKAEKAEEKQKEKQKSGQKSA